MNTNLLVGLFLSLSPTVLVDNYNLSNRAFINIFLTQQHRPGHTSPYSNNKNNNLFVVNSCILSSVLRDTVFSVALKYHAETFSHQQKWGRVNFLLPTRRGPWTLRKMRKKGKDCGLKSPPVKNLL